MNKSLTILLLSFCVVGKALALNENAPIKLDHGFINIGYDWVEVEGADFNNVFSVEAGMRWSLNQALFLETSLTGVNDSDTDTVEDNRGAYRLTLDSWDFLLGGVYQHSISDTLLLYGRGGLLMYRMQLDLEESFYDLKAAGSDSVSDNGFGLYAGLGCQLQLDPNWYVGSEFVFKRRSDFLDDSSRPFDVDTYSLNLGVRYHF